MKPNLKIKIKEEDKKKFIIAGVVVFLVVDIFMIFGWQIRSLVHYFSQTKEQSQEIESMKKDIANKESSLQQLNDFDKVIDDLKGSVTSETDIPVLMENISTLANTIGVKIFQIRPVFQMNTGSASYTVAVNKEKFSKIGIEITAQSGFHHLGTFISRLEAEKNLFRLSSIEIESDSRNYLVQNIRLSLVSAIRLEQKEKNREL